MFVFRIIKKIARRIYRKIKGRMWCIVHDSQDRFTRSGYSLSYDKERNIHVDGKGLHITGKADNTVHDADEILCGEGYHFYINEPYVMFDIGFDIGTASLYGARNEYIKKVYSFEPFGPTREIGEANLRNNPELAKKIKLFDFGLGGYSKEVEIHYNPERPGWMSTTHDKYSNEKNLKTEKVQVKKSSEVLKPLFEQHNERKFLKVDCEGSEYEIIPDLESSGLLKDVSVIAMECHYEDPQTLIDILARNNFNVHCTRHNHHPDITGFLVAFKK